MPPPRWQTPSQLEFLRSYLSSYLIHVSNSKLSKFWPIVTEAWFSKWPEIDAQKALNNIPAAYAENESLNPVGNTEVLFPDLIVNSADVLKRARKRRKAQLKHWFRNNSKDNKPSQNPPLNHLNLLSQPHSKNKRRHHRTEIYEKLYAEKISIALKTELALSGEGGSTDGSGSDESDMEKKTIKGKKKKSEWMKTRRRLVKELWEAETQEVRREVEEAWEAEGKVHDQDDVQSEQTSPENLQRAIEGLPEYMSGALNHQKTLTKWVGMAVLGGPKPNADGRLDIITVHVGKTDMGNNFADSHPDFNRDVIGPFGAWLKRVFPSSVRQESAIVIPSQNVSPSHTVDDTLTVSQFSQLPTSNDLPNLSDPALISMNTASAGSKSPKKRKKRKNKGKATANATDEPPISSAASTPLPQAFSSTFAPLPLPKTPVQVPRATLHPNSASTITPVNPGHADWSPVITPFNASSPPSSSPLKTPNDRLLEGLKQRLFLNTSPSPVNTAYPDLELHLQPLKEPTDLFEPPRSQATPHDLGRTEIDPWSLPVTPVLTPRNGVPTAVNPGPSPTPISPPKALTGFFEPQRSQVTPHDLGQTETDPWSLPVPPVPTRNGVPTAVNPAPSPTPTPLPGLRRRQPAFKTRLGGLESQSDRTSAPHNASPGLPLPADDNIPLPPDKSSSPQQPQGSSPLAPQRKYKGWVYVPITSPQAGERNDMAATEPALGRRVAKRRLAADGSELVLPMKKARTEAREENGKGKGKGKGSKGKGKERA